MSCNTCDLEIVVTAPPTIEVSVVAGPTIELEIPGIQGAPGVPGSGSYDQSSPTDGIAVVGNTLRIDIDSLPYAD